MAQEKGAEVGEGQIWADLVSNEIGEGTKGHGTRERNGKRKREEERR